MGFGVEIDTVGPFHCPEGQPNLGEQGLVPQVAEQTFVQEGPDIKEFELAGTESQAEPVVGQGLDGDHVGNHRVKLAR